MFNLGLGVEFQLYGHFPEVFGLNPWKKLKVEHIPFMLFEILVKLVLFPGGWWGCFSFGVQTSGEYISTMFGCI